MTASRTDLEDGAAPPPVFPILPYAYMAYAEHCSHDYAHYVDKLAHADESPLHSQEALGFDMLNDMNRAFFALVWAPFGAAIGRAKI
jgi:hypothetical protein